MNDLDVQNGNTYVSLLWLPFHFHLKAVKEGLTALALTISTKYMNSYRQKGRG